MQSAEPRAEGDAAKDDSARPATEQPADDASRRDDWMACFVNGTQVGYMHLVTESVVIDDQPCVRYRYDDELKMMRFQDTTVIQTNLECLEKATGQLLRFRSEVKTGPGVMSTEGAYDQGQLSMQVTTAGRTESAAIPWDPNWGGFFADQRSLAEKPMKPREVRRVKALLPILNTAGEVRMEAVGYEATPLLDGTRQLLRIDVTTDAGTTQLRSIVWTDEEGRAWKSRDLQLQLEAVRCSRETALRPTTGQGLDLGAGTVVRLDEPLASARRTTRVVYRATLTEGEVDGVFVRDGSQSVRILSERAVELTVHVIRPDRPDRFPDAAWTAPTPVDREASSLIQSDDPLIVRMASQVAPNETDPWKIACELERFVKNTVQLKNYTTAMATAAEVARSREGDCTEHAVLLAGLCRARSIPARVAVGLVYYPPAQGFAYHMWTEVWISDRWIGLDATLGEGGIGADHLKLAVSSMQGSNAFADMLPIVQVIGRLRLEVLSVDREPFPGS